MKGRCDDCDATVINGVLCHEYGCPTRRRELEEARRREFEEDWDDAQDQD